MEGLVIFQNEVGNIVGGIIVMLVSMVDEFSSSNYDRLQEGAWIGINSSNQNGRMRAS